MKTAYELLGVPRAATQSEIEQRYRFSLNAQIARCGNRRLPKRDRARLRAMRDAYLLLASPSRRQAYDHALQMRERRRRRIVESGGTALAVLSLLAGIVLIGDYWRLPHDAQPPKLAEAERALAPSQNASPAADRVQTR